VSENGGGFLEDILEGIDGPKGKNDCLFWRLPKCF
jgi:hypothetical protein